MSREILHPSADGFRMTSAVGFLEEKKKSRRRKSRLLFFFSSSST